MTEVVSPVFGELAKTVRVPIGDSTPLRAPQSGAIHAIAAHFTNKREPAIITLPTGAGKTAVLLAAPILLQSNRVLVLAPSRMLREQLAAEFKSLQQLIALALVGDAPRRPRVKPIREKIGSAEEWQELHDFDVIVATPNAVSPASRGVAAPPADFFDLILVDEAHHTPARTWSAVLGAFPKARAVLATATPFRLDERPLEGRFVYTYSMREAVRDGLYSKIQFKPVTEKIDGSWDIAIAKRAAEQLLADVDAGWDHRLLVRTDRQSRARDLKSIYEAQTPLRLEILDVIDKEVVH